MEKELQELFEQFKREELGNRLSQFALAALYNAVMSIVNKPGKDDGKDNPSNK